MGHDADVIVVGAGPAGSTAAAVLARAGIRVLLLDREAFPRDKTCGDAIPADGFRALREVGFDAGRVFDLSEYFAIQRATLRGMKGASLTLNVSPARDLTARIIPRTTFDAALQAHAVSSGAEFRLMQVTEPIREGGTVVGVRGKYNKRPMELRSKIVIAADGATSVIARALGSFQQRDDRWAVALRAYVRTTHTLEQNIDFVFLDKIQPGYAWFFPINAHLANVGVGMRADFFKKQSATLNDALTYYLSTPQVRPFIDGQPVEAIRTWRIPIFSFDLRRVFDGALLVGDAGGFVDPVSGAGIHYGIITGKLAAETSIEAIRTGDHSVAALRQYDGRWMTALGNDLRRALRLHSILATFPALIDVLLTAARVLPALIPRFIGKV